MRLVVFNQLVYINNNVNNSNNWPIQCPQFEMFINNFKFSGGSLPLNSVFLAINFASHSFESKDRKSLPLGGWCRCRPSAFPGHSTFTDPKGLKDITRDAKS